MSWNWRKPLILSGLRLTGSPVTRELKLLESIEWKSPEEIAQLQEERLTRLLLHAWRHTDYYRDVLTECGVVRDGSVDLDRFDQIPFLTKDIIRQQGPRLRARQLPKGRKAYKNSSGGSTGQPVEFWQDNVYWDVNVATKIYHFAVAGKQIGEPEMKIWGNEQDLFKGTIGWKAKLQNFAYNRLFQQCFFLPEDRVRAIIRNVDRFKPKLIWCYRDGMDVVANYVNEHGLQPHSPAAVICGGSTLYPHIAEAIEKAFQAPVINAYGSREMGEIACQCRERTGLHISSHSHVLETIDDRGNTVMDEDGEIAVTSLHNYAMPFIRYRIGDRGRLTRRTCPCGRGFPLLDSLSGRVIETFVTADGSYVDTMYFIHLIGVVYNSGFVDKFQAIQEDYSRIRIKMILVEGWTEEAIRPQLAELTEKIRLVMGEGCEVIFDFVDDIPLSNSGKHLYMIRKPTVVAASGKVASER